MTRTNMMSHDQQDEDEHEGEAEDEDKVDGTKIMIHLDQQDEDEDEDEVGHEDEGEDDDDDDILLFGALSAFPSFALRQHIMMGYGAYLPGESAAGGLRPERCLPQVRNAPQRAAPRCQEKGVNSP